MTDQNNDDHLRLQQAETLLSQKNKNPISALRTKAIALVKLDRDRDALNLFDEHQELREAATDVVKTGEGGERGGGKKRDGQLECAYAYALYKCGRFEDVKRIFGGSDDAEKSRRGRGRGLRHVLAQAAYRAEDFETAKSMYGSLKSGGTIVGVVNESHDVSVNEKAVDAQLEWATERVAVPNDAEFDGFEEAFNIGCRCVATGDLGRAQELFRKASDLCNESDLSEEEQREELCYIHAQQVYLMILRQNNDRAKQMSSSLDLSLLKDQASKRLVYNNALLYSKTDYNPYLLQRTLSNQEPLPADAYFFGIQKQLLQRNDLALDLATRKYDSLRKPKSPNSSSQLVELSESIYKAAAECRCHDNKAVKKRLLRYLRRHPDDVGALLLLLHLHVRNKKRKAALSQLNEFFINMKSFPPATTRQINPYLPGLISIWLVLISPQSQNRSTGGPSGCTLSKNGALIKTGRLLNQRFDTTDLSDPLSRVAGATLLTSSNSKDLHEARKILSSVAASDGSDKDSSEYDEDDKINIDPVAKSGIIAAEAQSAAFSYPPSSPPALENDRVSKAMLTPIPQIIKPLDAAALERQGGRFQPMHQSSQHSSQSTQKRNKNSTISTPTNKSKSRSNPKTEASKQKSKRTPRKRHLLASKQTDAASGPSDPERWLALRDRSSYKPPRSKTGKGAGGGGGSAGAKAKEKGASKGTSGGRGGGGGGGRQGGA